MRFFLAIFCVSLLSGCASRKVVDLKSPCVSADGGPCERRPVNTWLFNGNVRSVSI